MFMFLLGEYSAAACLYQEPPGYPSPEGMFDRMVGITFFAAGRKTPRREKAPTSEGRGNTRQVQCAAVMPHTF
jgi:hypothetical protein